jgi:hypothetical protein
MKQKDSDGCVYFTCDGCQKVLNVGFDEKETLKKSRKMARKLGWVWKHPHWQLYCPECKD